MPFTPFHFGPALFIYGLFVFLDPLAVIYGAILVDIEPALGMFLRLNYPLHGYIHSIVGILLLLPIVFAATFITRRLLPDLDRLFTSKTRKFPYALTIASALIGSFSHIILDSILYLEMNLAWPLPYWNPLFDALSSFTVYQLCWITLIVAIPLILLRRNYDLLKKLFRKTEKTDLL